MTRNVKDMKRRLVKAGDKEQIRQFDFLVGAGKAITRWKENNRRRLEGRAIQDVQISNEEPFVLKQGRKCFEPCYSIPPDGVIIFHRIPPEFREHVEHKIEVYLVHETLHIVLYILDELEAMAKLDQITTDTGELQIS